MATSTTGVRGTATLQASTSVGAGSSQNSSSIDLTTKLLADLRGLITNGGALGAPCVVMVQVSSDNSTWKDTPMKVAPAGVANGAAVPFFFKGLQGGQYYRLTFNGHTTNSVTVEAFADYLTSLSTA